MVRIQSMCSYLCGASGVAAVLLGVVMLFGSVAVGDEPPVQGPGVGMCNNGPQLRCDADCEMAPTCPETALFCATTTFQCDACKCRAVTGSQNCNCRL